VLPEGARPITPPHRIAIFGATSAIAAALARRYAAAGAELFLVARRADDLERLAADLRVRGAAAVTVATADLADSASHAALMERAAQDLPAPDAVVLAWGTLTDQARAEEDPAYALDEFRTNFDAPAALLLRVARWLEPRGQGAIAVITSVAGDRGRQSNFVYGAAKGGLQRFVEGLRHRLAPRGIAVVDVRPGFVATPMTAHLDRKGPLWATPERVAADVEVAIARGRAVLYTPWFWRWIMTIVTGLPRPVFHRTKL
jgi:decaprenylphospho-beta-D-erythro-pentofuranosid-2-ulose 2-reductase